MVHHIESEIGPLGNPQRESGIPLGGISPDGEIIEGEFDAGDRHAAVVDRLRAQGHVPIRAEPQVQPAGGRRILPRLFQKRRVRRADLVLLTQELATLLGAGLPLDRGLGIILELAETGPLRDLVEELRGKVQGGATLADAMQDLPELFPNFYIGMIRAGEAGGTLEVVLARLAETLERTQALRDNVRAALRYPALVVIMAGISIVVLMTAVIPEMGFSLCFRSHQMFIVLLRSRHGFRTVPGDVRELLDLGSVGFDCCQAGWRTGIRLQLRRIGGRAVAGARPARIRRVVRRCHR